MCKDLTKRSLEDQISEYDMYVPRVDIQIKDFSEPVYVDISIYDLSKIIVCDHLDLVCINTLVCTIFLRLFSGDGCL